MMVTKGENLNGHTRYLTNDNRLFVSLPQLKRYAKAEGEKEIVIRKPYQKTFIGRYVWQNGKYVKEMLDTDTFSR